MGYDKDKAAEEFARWSESYDRCVLQWLLFGPSHRVLIRRIQAVAGNRPFRVLDVGCGTGLFASRIKAALPRAEVWGVDLVSDMLAKGPAAVAASRRRRSCRSRATASGCRSPRGPSTSSPAPTAFTTIPARTARWPRCSGCSGPGAGS